jgi:hypothetical protein
MMLAWKFGEAKAAVNKIPVLPGTACSEKQSSTSSTPSPLRYFALVNDAIPAMHPIREAN